MKPDLVLMISQFTKNYAVTPVDVDELSKTLFDKSKD